MRLFLGIDLPKEIKSSIHQKRIKVASRSKGWTNEADLHLTLLFIGESSREDLYEIERRMRGVRFNDFYIQLTGLEFFNRRILYIGTQPSIELNELKKVIDSEFPEWVKPGSKEFVPHVTLKRWQRYEYEELKKQVQDFKFFPQTFRAKSLVLFESKKDELDNKYHELFKIDFIQVSDPIIF